MRVLGDSVKARYLEQLGRAAPPPADAARKRRVCRGPLASDGLPVALPARRLPGRIRERDRRRAAREARRGAGSTSPARACSAKSHSSASSREIEATLVALGVRFDVYTNEKTFYDDGSLDRVLADLRAEDLVYDADGAVWLRATRLGLERDRVLVKSSGEPTYLLPDIAYHRDKLRARLRPRDRRAGRRSHRAVPVRARGDRRAGLRRRSRRAGDAPVRDAHARRPAGEAVDTRRATYVTVDELLEEVGKDVFRFFMVQRKADGHLDFDVDLAKDRDWKKNPAFYVQYAHARTHGIERKAIEQGVAMPARAAFDASPLVLGEEITLIKKLLEFPDVVAAAAAAREPHHVAYYLREVAGLWNPYVQDGVHHRVLADDAALSQARLGLALGVRDVLAQGLAILGLSAPERM